MAYLLFFVCQLVLAIRDIVDGAPASNYIRIGDDFLTLQVVTWCVWTLTEIYYTYKGVEWGVIGPVHVALCVLVLSFSVAAKIEYHNWALTV